MIVDFLQERDALHGFAQAHLVRQNTVSLVVPIEQEPVDALELVISQLIVVQKLAVRRTQFAEGLFLRRAL